MRSFFITGYLLSILSSFGQSSVGDCIANAAFDLTEIKVAYDPTYYTIKYPMGDIPSNRGVCTDVIIRALRQCERDLQELVHKDMKENFDEYPKNWGLSKPDTHIDHRRVPNLMVFFKRQGLSIKITNKSEDYLPGDIVCWDLGNGILHIGIVSSKRESHSNVPLIIHNIGDGQVCENFLFDRKIIGHYRYR